MIRSVRRALFVCVAAATLVVPAGAAASKPKPGPAPGTIVVAGDSLDNQYSAVVAYPPSGTPTEIGGGTNLACATVDGHGTIYFCHDADVIKLPANGGASSKIPVGAFPLDIAADNAGNLFVALDDIGEDHVEVAVFPANGGPLHAIGGFDQPKHITIDQAGNLYVIDSFGLWRIRPDGTGKTQLGGTTFADSSGVVVDPAGTVYAADANDGVLRVLSSSGSPVRTITGLSHPGSPAIERSGTVLVTVTDPVRIIRMRADGSRRRTAIDHQFGDVAVYLPYGSR